MLGLVGPALAVGIVRPQHRFELAMMLFGASLSWLGAFGSAYLLPWGVTVGMVALFRPQREALLLLLPLMGWGSAALGGGPVLSGVLGGAALGLLAARVRRARDLPVAGVVSGGAAAAGALVTWPTAGWIGVGAAALSGPASVIVIAALLPLVEQVIGRTSRLTLAELLSPAHPLLERLRLEAPGTYYHARDVAALAEAGARAVGADPLLAAVGGLYHDIGKLMRPQFFAENQNGTNPHDELPPTMSKVVLASHVKDGTELGRQYGLRGDVLNHVATHHGTGVMHAFSRRAADLGLSEDEFRYVSPLPATKETAVVMLADAVEAYARGRGREDLADVVDRVIADRREDGQLNQAPLTLADLTKLRRAFVEVLQGLAHRRAEGFPPPE
ncbi:TPA: hypothetical protein DCY65_01845 [Candidatus Acetothermia bacterium]|nr:hypothetical protein [Candidatus Acetothermia bacterium]